MFTFAGKKNSSFDDGKFNIEYLLTPFPGYIKNPKNPFTTVFPRQAGIYNWMLSDDEENLKENLKTMPLDWKYRSKPVTYTLNSDGYRAPEWDQIDWKNSIILFGCSCTYGQGVSDEETIHYQLEKLVGRPVINLGVCAGSNNLMIQNAISLLENYPTPYAVANIWSCTDRFRFFMDDSYVDLGSWTKFNKTLGYKTLCDIDELWKQMFVDPTHELVLAYYEGQIGKWLWQDRAKYASLSFFDHTAHYTRSDAHFEIDNQARDLIHPGEDNFKQVAEFLAEKFK
jgi:hypothetical protein